MILGVRKQAKDCHYQNPNFLLVFLKNIIQLKHIVFNKFKTDFNIWDLSTCCYLNIGYQNKTIKLILAFCTLAKSFGKLPQCDIEIHSNFLLFSDVFFRYENLETAYLSMFLQKTSCFFSIHFTKKFSLLKRHSFYLKVDVQQFFLWFQAC
jgi:hypothetical protein